MSGTKQSPGEKEKGGNRNRGGIFSKDLPAFFSAVCYIIKCISYCKGCLMCYLGGRKREDALDDLPTSEF